MVTNPPYSKKDLFIEKCFDIQKPFALLLPVESLAGKKRVDMWMRYGLEVLVFDKRVDFSGDKRPYFPVAWFCRGILPSPLMFHKINP